MASKAIRVLLVAAHPADAFDQCGGTLAHHIKKGDAVTVLVATLGTRSHDWMFIDTQKQKGKKINVEQYQEKEKQKKLKELRKACRILGIKDVRTLDFYDDEELLTEKMVQDIADVIREVRPAIMITHHPYEDGGFKLHATVGRATIFAYRKAATTGRGKSLSAFMVPSIYFMNPTAYVGVAMDNSFIAKIDLYIDITDVIDKKVKAMDCISSQYYKGSFARKRAEATDGHYGYNAGVGYAEAFQRYYPAVSYTLPISDFELERYKVLRHYVESKGTLIAANVPLPKGAKKSKKIVPREAYNY